MYKQKLMSAQEAVKLVKSGDKVYIGIANSIAYQLMEALWERRSELEDVTIMFSQANRYTTIFQPPYDAKDNPFKIETFFIGHSERIAVEMGMPVDYTSFSLSEINTWVTKVGKPTVAFLEVSPMDENGGFSLGASGGALGGFAADVARDIILQVNENQPYICGEKSIITIKQASAVVEMTADLAEVVTGTPTEVETQISKLIVDEIPDGATFQLGVGGLSTAIGYGLAQKNDLGIYSELLCEPMVQLMKSGNVTNTKKGFHDGVSVFAFSLGSKSMYEYMDHNNKLYNATFRYVNDPRNIAKNKNFMSINTAMSVDIFGQVAADRIGMKQQSACGGQIDFVRGAQWSEGGKSFIALQSSDIVNGKRRSKIAFQFPVGTTVTTARADVQYVVTEYGCVNLKELNMSDRVKAMISLAHPDFRDELTQQAKDYKII